MRCFKCGATLPDDSKFCQYCGEDLSKSDCCVACGAQLTPEMLFCPKCGNKKLHASVNEARSGKSPLVIFDKDKHFNGIIETLFNMSMADIRELNLLLTPYGAKPYIEKNKEKFVTVSFLYILFFQECALQKRYFPKYKQEASAVLDAMLSQIADRFNYDSKKLTAIYFDVRKRLDSMSASPEVIKVGLYYGVAVLFLHYAFSGEYDIEEGSYDDDTPFVKVAEFFQRVMNDTTEILSS